MDRQALEDRARDAQDILTSPIFVEAVKELRRSIVEQLLAKPAGDPQVLELHTEAKLVDKLVGELRRYVSEIKVRRLGQER